MEFHNVFKLKTKTHFKKFYNPDDLMWVVGCIDSYGAITARAVNGAGDVMHSANESRGKRWRWNIWGQEFIATRNPSHDKLSEEEFETVCDWLIKKGFKKPN